MVDLLAPCVVPGAQWGRPLVGSIPSRTSFASPVPAGGCGDPRPEGERARTLRFSCVGPRVAWTAGVALDQLSRCRIVMLDEERKVTRVSSLPVVPCGDHETLTMVNSVNLRRWARGGW